MTIQITKPETPKVRKQLVERPNIQTLSLKAIVADAAFQPRVETDPAHVLTFDKMIRNGHEVYPVDVFWTGEKYILVDGFHRYLSHLKMGLTSIQATVHLGTERDAKVFAAGANKVTNKEPTVKDRKKAVMMLLEDEEWRNKTDMEIARHVGIVSGATVRKYKVEFTNKNGVPVRFEKRSRWSSTVRKSRTKGGGLRYYASINGRYVDLGSDAKEAEERRSRLVEEFCQKRKPITTNERMLQHLVRRCIIVSVFGEDPRTRLSCRVGGGFVFDVADYSDVPALRDAILNVVIARKARCDGGRAVVLGYPEIATKITSRLIELAKPLGVEFMTPEEFIDSFAATDESAPADEPMLD